MMRDACPACASVGEISGSMLYWQDLWSQAGRQRDGARASCFLQWERRRQSPAMLDGIS